MPGDVLAVNVDFAGVGGDQADEELEQNALAAAAHADDGHRLALLDGEIHAVQDAERAEAFLQIGALQSSSQEGVEEHGQKEIGDEDGDGRINHRFGGGVAHPFGPLGTTQPLVTGDHGDDAAEDEGLDDAGEHVGDVGVADHLVPGVGLVDAEQEGGDQIGGPNAQRRWIRP